MTKDITAVPNAIPVIKPEPKPAKVKKPKPENQKITRARKIHYLKTLANDEINSQFDSHDQVNAILEMLAALDIPQSDPAFKAQERVKAVNTAVVATKEKYYRTKALIAENDKPESFDVSKAWKS